jgi:methylenetetrahydrofolate reductase (NADPH)
MSDARLHSDRPSTRLRRLLAQASVEVSAREGSAVERVRANFPKGTEVFVNALPGDDLRRSIELAARLRAAGYEPVPHIAARGLAGPQALEEILNRARGQAGIRRVLLIAGDVETPAGPYAASLDVLRTGLLARFEIDRVGFAGHPEEHPHASRERLLAELAAKVAEARGAGHDVEIVTQFGFDAAAIRSWLRSLPDAGIHAPVRLGLAGPASAATLLRYAIRCGIGNSMRALQARPGAMARLFGDVSPDALLRDLVASPEPPEVAAIRTVHLFPFGGLAKTGEWLRLVLADHSPES